MVTPRTGRPRGRPRKPRPPPRPSHRPPLLFLEDPDRYLVAALDAMLALEMGSLRACSTAVAVLFIGLEGDPPKPSSTHVVTNWHRDTTKSGARAATIEGRAGSLRKKYNTDVTLEAGIWRGVMGRCFCIVFAAKDSNAAKAKVVALATTAGEEKFARSVLLPMIDAGRPNFVGL